MRELTERIDVDATPEQVWAALTDWERQGEWMLATDVETVGGRRSGCTAAWPPAPGCRCPAAGTSGVLDTMIITKWEPPRLIEVQHTGRIVRGPGIFEIEPRGEHATFVWTERLWLPYGLLGQAGFFLTKPFVVWGIRRSLRRFAEFARRHRA